ncbi:hypothetical protein CLU79DRAFT_749028 [Phycomyces nitens]|nr:hypothetical protein CLU79DRAFT_749028 [Phycomyces nitens]
MAHQVLLMVPQAVLMAHQVLLMVPQAVLMALQALLMAHPVVPRVHQALLMVHQAPHILITSTLTSLPVTLSLQTPQSQKRRASMNLTKVKRLSRSVQPLQWILQ